MNTVVFKVELDTFETAEENGRISEDWVHTNEFRRRTMMPGRVPQIGELVSGFSADDWEIGRTLSFRVEDVDTNMDEREVHVVLEPVQISPEEEEAWFIQLVQCKFDLYETVESADGDDEDLVSEPEVESTSTGT